MSMNLFLEYPALLKIIFFLDILLKISEDFFTEHLLHKFVVYNSKLVVQSFQDNTGLC